MDGRIERLTVQDAMKAASFLAGVIGKAHARQMDEATRKGWFKELGGAVLAQVFRGFADREPRSGLSRTLSDIRHAGVCLVARALAGTS
ncbi:hypothetical protein [Bradyrhizobium sp.]|uniref:hypothetical protein n=1 Tax=Bradyrhizobium sp. TaxID=376 RepID=UPI002616099D|nr:hypothetical protein [Bradyrhizobium sp.]